MTGGGISPSSSSLAIPLGASTQLRYAAATTAAPGVVVTGGWNGITADRVGQLAQGATPATATEREWVTRYSSAMATVKGALDVLVGEARRQAALGRDVYGRPLNGGVQGGGGNEDHAYEQRVLELVNVERARYGLAPLTYDQRLDVASERHNAQQAATRTMAHDGIGDGTPGQRIRATGFSSSWGENVATGQVSPEQVVAEWMASPGHRRNILDPSYRLLGVSYTVGADGRSYWAQSFGAP